MRIVLIGYMGSGKSTIGRLLAGQLGLEFYDLDSYIENKSDVTIPNIFKEKGEIYFRKMEHNYLNEILENEPRLVLATGGGTPCYSGNMHSMLDRSDAVIYLKLSIPKLIERLYKEKDERPLIAHLENEELPEFIGKHLFERSPYYAMANYTVLCDTKSPDEIVAEIQDLLV